MVVRHKFAAIPLYYNNIMKPTNFNSCNACLSNFPNLSMIKMQQRSLMSVIQNIKFAEIARSNYTFMAKEIHTSSNKQLPQFDETLQYVFPPKPMTEQEVCERVLKAIKAWDRFPQNLAENLTLDSRFVEDLSFDSLDLVEIVMSLEDEFGMEMEDSVAHEFKTPSDVCKHVCERELVGSEEGL